MHQLCTNAQVDKVQFVSHIKQLPSPERRNAELALFCHQPQQAEAIYLQAGLVFRAIKLNTNLFNWERYKLLVSLKRVLFGLVLVYIGHFLKIIAYAAIIWFLHLFFFFFFWNAEH